MDDAYDWVRFRYDEGRLVTAIDRETGLASYGRDRDEAVANLLDILDLFDGD